MRWQQMGLTLLVTTLLTIGFGLLYHNGAPGPAVALAAGTESAAPLTATVVISDGIFAPHNWQLITVASTFSATATASQIMAGGNPDSYRAITHTLPTPPEPQLTQLTAAHLYTATRYNPATQGAIDTIDFQQDARLLNLPWEQAFTSTQVLLRQGGRLYRSTQFIRTIADLTWQRSALTGLGATDFVALDGSGTNPDFSATGGPIAFGFVRGNSRFADNPPVPPGDLVYAHAIDNWAVTIQLESTAGVAELVLAPDSPAGKSYVNFELGSTDFFALGTPANGITITNRGTTTATGVTVALTFAVPDHYGAASTTSSLACDTAGTNCAVEDLAPDAQLNFHAFRRYQPTRGYGVYQGAASFEARVATGTVGAAQATTAFTHRYELFFCNDGDSSVCPLQALFCLENFTDLHQRMTAAGVEQAPQVEVKDAAEIVIDLPLYYQLRDSVMVPRVDGKRLAARYATHGPEITALLVASDTLRSAAVNTVSLWEPNFARLVSGDGTAVITQAQVNALSALLTALAAAGSSELEQAIATELTTLGDLNDYVGMEMAAAEVAVLGEAVPGRTIYLPLLRR